MEFTILARLDGLNEYTKACRSNAYVGNKMKMENELIIKAAIKKAILSPISKYPVKLIIDWYEPNRKRDIDNITFATKFILDSLVKTKILQDDSQKYINEIEHHIYVDKNKPHIDVKIIELGGKQNE